MEGTRDNISLLLGSELYEVNGIAGNPDGKLRIILGMLLCIEKSISVKNGNVKMVSALGSVTIEKVYKVANLCF